jgi:small subunit ribosomal protein S13
MARIGGVDLPKDKRIETALTYLYGIGLTLSQKILQEAEVSPDTRVKNLTEEEVNKIKGIVQRDYQVEGALRREIANNIKRLIEAGAYRGIRHKRNLPVRGQRTRTNARTKRGARRTVGAVKAKEETKTAEKGA